MRSPAPLRQPATTDDTAPAHMDAPVRALSPADHRPIAAWFAAIHSLLRANAEVLKEHNLSPLEYQLMLELRGRRDSRGMSITALAARLHARHNFVVHLANRLCHKGYAARSRSTTDQRVVELQLTPGGREALEQILYSDWGLFRDARAQLLEITSLLL